VACLDVDAVDGGPCIHLNNRPLLSLLLVKLASSTSPQKPPATIRGSMILDHIRTWFLGGGGDLYARATYTRVYTVGIQKTLISSWAGKRVLVWHPQSSLRLVKFQSRVVVSVSNVSVSRRSRGVFWTSLSHLDTVTPTSRSCLRLETLTSRYRLGLGIIRLIYTELLTSNFKLQNSLFSTEILRLPIRIDIFVCFWTMNCLTP